LVNFVLCLTIIAEILFDVNSELFKLILITGVLVLADVLKLLMRTARLPHERRTTGKQFSRQLFRPSHALYFSKTESSCIPTHISETVLNIEVGLSLRKFEVPIAFVTADRFQFYVCSVEFGRGVRNCIVVSDLNSTLIYHGLLRTRRMLSDQDISLLTFDYGLLDFKVTSCSHHAKIIKSVQNETVTPGITQEMHSTFLVWEGMARRSLEYYFIKRVNLVHRIRTESGLDVSFSSVLFCCARSRSIKN
jgi:hypothetical protein